MKRVEPGIEYGYPMFIHSLDLYDVLSFRRPTLVELSGLNILIGPNGVGKSNLIECLALLQSLPSNVNAYLLRNGGVDEWIRKGRRDRNKGCTVACVLEVAKQTVLYELSFSSANNSLVIESESLISPKDPKASLTPYLQRTGSNFLIRPKLSEKSNGGNEFARNLKYEMSAPIGTGDSVFAIYRNPFDTTPITRTAQALGSIRIYREFKTGMTDGARYGIASTSPKYPLDDGGANLALVLQEMDFHGSLKKVKDYLRRLLDRFEDLKIRLVAGLAQVYIMERGAGAIPATRLSDGTLKFLCLMAILCDHDPPPLVCIEEPEVGLHPDALRLVAEALKEASSRMQIVVTTRSDALVDHFSDEPEAILVCERETDESTQFKRLQRDQLQDWLEDYTLGDLWRRGGVGGTLR